MKRATLLLLSILLASAALAQASGSGSPTDASAEVFWTAFSAAVAKGDKATVANLSQFPIGMPYGVPSIKTRTQLLQRFRKVFSSETDAAKCFAKARPAFDPGKPKAFEVTCKNAAGDDVIVYSFALTRSGWKFRALDNINE